jgi:dTDP-4-amino-4,6-dideoxygalactose transaminase
MSALLCDLKPGDEVIVPTFTFVSTANAFVMRGARIVFVDSRSDHPGIDEKMIEELVTKKTKAIVPVHYAGIACDMDPIMDVAKKYDLHVVEDAAQAVDSYYKNLPLGSIGHLGCFSFHETKNIQCGEGGMLTVNLERFSKRAEIIWEKGTNRTAFFRGEIDKYGWVDIGSSFLLSDLLAAFLYAQATMIEEIQGQRLKIWQTYYDGLKFLSEKGFICLPVIPEYATNNGHMFYFVCRESQDRDQLISFLKSNGISAIFHYLPLHDSSFYCDKHDGRILKNARYFSENIVRLPFFFELHKNQQELIIEKIHEYFRGK